MYELFVLGQLMDHEMAGYHLRQALKAVVGPEQTVSYGVLYPLLDRLQRVGDITLQLVTPSPRPKKMAAITEQGRTHFQTLVMIPVTINKQAQLLFQIKCSFLHLLTGDQQQQVLRDFQAFGQYQLTNLQAVRDYLHDHPKMVPTDIADAMAVNRLQQLRAQAQVDWIRGRLAQLAKGE